MAAGLRWVLLPLPTNWFTLSEQEQSVRFGSFSMELRRFLRFGAIRSRTFFTTIACTAVLGNHENARIYIGVTAAALAVLFPMLQDSVWSDLGAWADA